MKLFEELIDLILTKGISVELSIKDGVRYYDLNTGAKSHLHLSFNVDGQLVGDMRYGKFVVFNLDQSLESLLYDVLCEIKGCMYGRDYVNTIWADLMVEAGILTRKVTTTITYE